MGHLSEGHHGGSRSITTPTHSFAHFQSKRFWITLPIAPRFFDLESYGHEACISGGITQYQKWGRSMSKKIDAGINAVKAIRDLLQIDDEWAG